MTDIDRSAVNRALAKAIAYHNCGKPASANAWAIELVRLLGSEGILSADIRQLPRRFGTAEG